LRIGSNLLFLLIPVLAGCGPLSEKLNQLGVEEFNHKNYAGARSQFKQSLFLDRSRPAFHNNLGYDYYFLKEYDKAEEEFRQALSLGADGALLRQIRINQVILYGDSTVPVTPGHKEWNGKGVGILKELLTSEPDNAEYHMRLGFAYFRQANPGGGFQELELAVHWADPKVVAKYSSDPVQGSLLILKQIQQFYLRAGLIKRAWLVQKTMSVLEKPH